MTETVRSVEKLITGKETKLVGDFTVRRILPKRELRRIGGFVFLDHFGKVTVDPRDFDVPPHPHIGLQTVTYLFSGEILHKDSLGSEQVIKPGDVNWMTAGKGITHSEQAIEFQEYHGIQTWVGLPHKFRKTNPSFEHFSSDLLPLVKYDGSTIRIIAGDFDEMSSPIPTFQELTYLDVEIFDGSGVSLPVANSHELGVYVVEGAIYIDNVLVKSGILAKLSDSGNEIIVESVDKARLIVFGGATLAEPTVIYWNFIADTLDEAKRRFEDWENGKFPDVAGYVRN